MDRNLAHELFRNAESAQRKGESADQYKRCLGLEIQNNAEDRAPWFRASKRQDSKKPDTAVISQLCPISDTNRPDKC